MEKPLVLNCPKCPRQMDWIGHLGPNVDVYRCPVHGEWRLSPGGLYRPDEPPKP